MTENEALEYLKSSKRKNDMLGILPGSDIGNTIIKALEEVQQYRTIGTPEECLRNKDFLDFLADKMNPNDFEIYLQIYNSQDVKGGGVDGD
nr:MAG TPA: hypothetical protein [Caudoviricetes sp.]